MFTEPGEAAKHQDIFGGGKCRLDNLLFKLDSFGDFEVDSQQNSDEYTEYSENGGEGLQLQQEMEHQDEAPNRKGGDASLQGRETKEPIVEEELLSKCSKSSSSVSSPKEVEQN